LHTAPYSSAPRDGGKGTSNETGVTLETMDFITDFNRLEGDKLDLYSIDANPLPPASGDQAFTFIGTDAFSSRAARPGRVLITSQRKPLADKINCDEWKKTQNRSAQNRPTGENGLSLVRYISWSARNDDSGSR
jgi:hypothetical protein